MWTIGEAVRSLAESMNATDFLVLQAVLMKWKEAVGSTVAAHASPIRLRGNELVVGCDSPPWSEQLTFLKPFLIQRLALAIGQDIIRDVRFVLRRKVREHNKLHRKSPIRIQGIPQQEAVPLDIQSVCDETLSTVFLRAFKAYVAAVHAQKQAGWMRCELCGCLHPPNTRVCPVRAATRTAIAQQANAASTGGKGRRPKEVVRTHRR